MKRGKLALACLMALALVSILFFSMDMSRAGTEHHGIGIKADDVIRINSNDEFASYGFPGSGTSDDPYILSGLNIDAHGAGAALYIGNTTAYFIVRDSVFYNASDSSAWPPYIGAGITLYNVVNGVIFNNTVELNNGYTGIYIESSSNNKILNNTIVNNHGKGITIFGDASKENLIENNTIMDNNAQGIYLGYRANNNTIRNNLFKRNLIGIEFHGAGYNYIVHNNFVANRAYGVYVMHDPLDKRNVFYNNSFYYNNGSGDNYNESICQAYDSGYNELWNTSAYGNYWHDWANKNSSMDPDGDGIIDYPYTVNCSGDVMDYLPLANPTFLIPPLEPRNLQFDNDTTYVNLTWEAPLGNGTTSITSYRIYRNGTFIAEVPASQLYYNDTSVTAGVEYTYYVTAVNSVGESEASNEVTAIPGGVIPEMNITTIAFLALILAVFFFKRR